MARYVEELEIVLSDGQVKTVRNNLRPEQDRLASACLDLLTSNAALISAATNKPSRARLGYQLRGTCHDGLIDLARLVCGSEGTLAVITKATIKAVSLPRAKALIQAAFGSLVAAAQTVPIIVEAGVSACELMDQALIQMAIQAYPHYSQILPADAAATLLIEVCSDQPDELTDRLSFIERALGPLACQTTTILEPDLQAQYWRSRTDAVPLLYRKAGREKPVPIIEDTTVDHRLLARYIQGLQQISSRLQTTFCYYGHAGDGHLHIRPYLDLGRPEDGARMRAIAEEVFALVWSLGGSISGEHAYGLLRRPYLAGEFGQEYLGLLKQVKAVFDPAGILNPGKLTEDGQPAVLRRSLAFIPERTSRLDTKTFNHVLDCNGCGSCRQTGPELRMCPVHKALNTEPASPRARANLVEAWLVGLIQGLNTKQAAEILRLCIHCKACSRQCPSGVDVSRIVVQTKAACSMSLGLTERLLGANARLCQLASSMPLLANLIMQSRPGKWLSEVLLGMDGSLRLPKFASGSLARKAGRLLEQIGPRSGQVEKVVYLPDAFVCLYDHKLGLDVIRVLASNGVYVAMPTFRPIPIPAIYYGQLHMARRQLRRLMTELRPFVESGFKIVVSEPSAALVLKEELPWLIDDPLAEAVAKQCHEVMSFLAGLAADQRLQVPKAQRDARYVYHQPCHGMALWQEPPSLMLLQAAGVRNIEQLDAGCCGMAGTFGMQRRHRDLRNRIAADLAERLRIIGPCQVISECSACRIQIANLAIQTRPIHPIQVLASAYKA
jgi:Fe-S oxidoreductase/FAD/FMN-containing dehydrogenase